MKPVPILTRRVGLIGDVHGESLALLSVLQFLKIEKRLDALLCTGDLPGKQGVGDTNRCCELLQKHNVFTIRGNHDRWFTENEEMRELLGMVNDPVTPGNRAYIATLPRTQTFDTPYGPLLLCHGINQDDMAGVYPWDGDDTPIVEELTEHKVVGGIMVAGHTHKRLVRRAGHTTIVNPGTLLWDKDPCFAIIDFEIGVVQFYKLTPFTNQIDRDLVFPLPKA